MSVEIVEIMDRSTQGVTLPFMCRGEDAEVYFVKGRGAGRRSLICEWIAGNLGLRFGLPIAPFKIVNVPESLIMIAPREDISDLGIGLAFGSTRRHIVELTINHFHYVPLNLQRDILAFDWWIRNGDRTLSAAGGNPNLFWDVKSNELIVIDHNQAFDPDFSPTLFLESHAFRAHAKELFEDWLVQDEYARRYAGAMEKWDEICDTIPNEWRYLDPELTLPVDFDLNALRQRLLACSGDAFWNAK